MPAKLNDVFTTDLSGAVLAYLVRFHDQHDASHSLQFTMEDALVTGLKAKFRSIEYGEVTRRNKAFVAEIAANPIITQDPAAMERLKRKYRIGSSNASSAAQAPITTVETEPEIVDEIQTEVAATAAELEKLTEPIAATTAA